MPRKAGGGDYMLRTRRILHKGGGGGVRKCLAMTTASHAPGATQAVNLCDDSFAELSPVKTKNAINDSLVTIPDNTKLYIEHFQGKWRIDQAFICTDPAP